MRCTAFSGVRRDFIGIHPKTLSRGIFARLVTFRHIVQFFPLLLSILYHKRLFPVKEVGVILRRKYRPAPGRGKGRYSFSKITPNTAPSIFHACQHLPTCESFNNLIGHRKHTHATRTHNTGRKRFPIVSSIVDTWP